MNTNRQIVIDKTIVKSVAFLLNICVKIAGIFFPKKHNLEEEFKTIAVCKFKGLGSIIQSTPLLQTLRNSYPHARILYISSSSNEEILKNIKIIDEVIILKDETLGRLIVSFFPFTIRLFRRKIEVYIDLEVYSNFSSVVTALSNAQNRLGYYLKESNYRLGIYTHMLYYNSSVPIYQTYLQWARLLNCKAIITELYELTADIKLISAGGNHFDPINEKYFLINPNASDLRIERRWPVDNFIQLIRHLLHDYPLYQIVLIGGRSEADYVNSIKTHFVEENVISMAGKTNVQELIFLIRNATFVITNDTGPMHIAFSTQRKTVALFGPCSPGQYGYHNNTVSLYKEVYCSPCVHEFRIPPCGGNNQCMKLISVEEVLQAILSLTAGHLHTGNEEKENSRIYKIDDSKEVLGMIKRSSD